MNTVFVLYNDLDCNSGIHVFNLANRLSDLGVNCYVCVPYNKEAVYRLGNPKFQVANFDEALSPSLLPQDGRHTLIHAWTPREIVREFSEKLVAQLQCRYVVHLEDNEEILVARNSGMSVSELQGLPSDRLDLIVPLHLSHPVRYRRFLSDASGVTAIIDRLLEFKPSHLPGKVIWPGFDENLFGARPIDRKLRGFFGIGDRDFVVVYPGNVHAANVREVWSLYLAVGLLNRRGAPVKLVRLGKNYVPLLDGKLHILRKYCIELGFIPRLQVPKIMAMADVFVQPGASNEFNDYRFPSKLPECFAIGRPVILPKTNIGRHLKDQTECLLLDRGDALDIARKLEMLLVDHEKREQMGNAGRAFAEQYCNWNKSAHDLAEFYDQVLQSC